MTCQSTGLAHSASLSHLGRPCLDSLRGEEGGVEFRSAVLLCLRKRWCDKKEGERCSLGKSTVPLTLCVNIEIVIDGRHVYIFLPGMVL